MLFCRSVPFRRFIPALGLIVACNACGENGGRTSDNAAPADSNAAIEDAIPQDPYAALEQIAPGDFHNRVVRADRAKRSMEDTLLAGDVRDYARAAFYYYSEKWDSAYSAYDALRSRDPKLEAEVVLRMAKSKFRVNDYDGMRRALTLGSKFSKNDAFARAAARLRVEASLADSTLGEKAHADSLKAFLDRFPKGDDAAVLKYRYASYLEQNKQQKQAKRYYMQLLTTSTPYRDSAFVAIRRLRTVQASPETLAEKVAYAKIACAKDEAQSRIGLLDSIRILDEDMVAKNPQSVQPVPEGSPLAELKSSLDMNTRIVLWSKRGDALKAMNRNDEAIAQFTFLIDSVEARAVWIQAALRLHRSAAKKNAKEIRRLDAMLQSANKYSKENANNLWVRGFEHEQQERYDSAVVTFEKLADKHFGNNIKHQWAKFRIGFIYFKQERWADAEKALAEAKREPFLWSGSASRYFLAETYMKMGKDSLARDAFLDCIADFPLGYYAHRSRMKLVEYELMEKFEVPYAKGVPMTGEATLAWVKNIQKGAKDPTYTQERYDRIKKLFQYGFSDEAFALYDEARKKNAKRLDFLYEYGNLFYEMGETAAGYRLARQFQANIDRRLLADAPIAILHYLFPLPYRDQVKFHSGTRIDPFFVYSVMRQESIFDYQITSPAGACGLLQIMPATGKMLAKQEYLDTFDPAQLYNPYMNIRLGVRYLVDLKAQYSNDYMYVLGNYNAGPKPTKRWQKAGEGKPWDIRAEEISYWETRDYVKRVMGNYWIYQEIYDEI
jgi:soluble lytic murein transglycosylase